MGDTVYTESTPQTQGSGYMLARMLLAASMPARLTDPDANPSRSPGHASPTARLTDPDANPSRTVSTMR